MIEIVIKGESGSGKTTLANKIKHLVEQAGDKAHTFDEGFKPTERVAKGVRASMGIHDVIIFVENS